MADLIARIEQFRKMAQADPTNELGHFSLGRALMEAGHHEDAVVSLQRVIELNPNLSKTYQLLAESLLKLGKPDQAITTLTQGVAIASARGDMMPRNEMVRMLREQGAPVPDAVSSAQIPTFGVGEVLCLRCGRAGAKLSKPPFKSAFGQQIFENICAACWKEAIGMGTKVINELRLPLSDPQAQKVWDQHIREFLNLQSP